MSALDPLLGRVLTNDVEIELSKGLNFKNGLLATLNPATNLTEVSFGLTADHGSLQIADGIHGSLFKTFPDQATRRAWPLTVLDMGKRALQLDNATIWDVVPSLLVPGTYVWGQSCAGPETLAFGGDFAALATSFGLTVRGFWRGDLGVTGTQGTGKAAWANQSGTASAMSSGLTDGVGSAGAGLNGKASVVHNGTSQNCAYTMPTQGAPLSLPTHKWFVFKATGVATLKILCVDNGGSAVALSGSADAAPGRNFSQYDGATGAVSAGVMRNQWYRGRASFMGDATSQIRIGAHAPAAADCGNNAPSTTRNWAGGAANTNMFECETLCLLELEGSLANFLAFDADAGPKAQTCWTSAIEI